MRPELRATFKRAFLPKFPLSSSELRNSTQPSCLVLGRGLISPLQGVELQILVSMILKGTTTQWRSNKEALLNGCSRLFRGELAVLGCHSTTCDEVPGEICAAFSSMHHFRSLPASSERPSNREEFQGSQVRVLAIQKEPCSSFPDS